MNTVYSIVSELKSTNSSLKKIEILNKNKDNDDLRLFFLYVLHPLKKYGLKRVPEYKVLDNSLVTFSDAISLLDSLNNKEFTGNAAIKKVQEFLNKCDYEMSEIFIMMLIKIARCGCSWVLAEKTWPGIFPTEIKLCKANAYSKKNLQAIHYPAYSQRKCDGARCLAIKKNGKVTFYSSGYQEYCGLKDLTAEVDSIEDSEFVLDGELLVVDSNGNTLPRKLGNGILTESIRKTISEEDAERVRFVVWDFIPYSEYESCSPSTSYKKIIEFLDRNISKKNLKRVSLVETKIVNSEEEAFSHFKYMLERGEEGTIVKNMDMKWANERSKNCVKFKIIIENTLEIVDTFEGNGKYEKCLGGFICKSSDGKVTVRVGSGINDFIRNEVWENRNSYIGKFVEVRSNGLIESSPGNYSLFLPRFSNFRDDKLEADSFEYIKELSDGSKMVFK